MRQHQTSVRFPCPVSVPRLTFSRLCAMTGLPSTDSESGLPTPPKEYSGSVGGGMTPPRDGRPSDPPKKVRSKGGWVGRLARNARRMFGAITRKLSGL